MFACIYRRCNNTQCMLNTAFVVKHNSSSSWQYKHWMWLPFNVTRWSMQSCCHKNHQHTQTHKQQHVSDNKVGECLHIEEFHCEGPVLLAGVCRGRPVLCTLDLVPLHNINKHHKHLAILLPNHMPKMINSAGQWCLGGDEFVGIIVPLCRQWNNNPSVDLLASIRYYVGLHECKKHWCSHRNCFPTLVWDSAPPCYHHLKELQQQDWIMSGHC